MIRNPAETEVPIIPPILLKEPNFELIAEAVAATTMDVTTTMLVEKGLLELRKNGWRRRTQNSVPTIAGERTLNDPEKRKCQQ